MTLEIRLYTWLPSGDIVRTWHLCHNLSKSVCGFPKLTVAPLHSAVSLVRFLLDNGASVLVKNRKHHDALRYSHTSQMSEAISRAAVEQAQAVTVGGTRGRYDGHSGTHTHFCHRDVTL